MLIDQNDDSFRNSKKFTIAYFLLQTTADVEITKENDKQPTNARLTMQSNEINRCCIDDRATFLKITRQS